LVTGSWDEQSLNWFNMPSYDSGSSCTLRAPYWYNNIWLSFDVTSGVSNWNSHRNSYYGFAILADADNQSPLWLYSREFGNPRGIGSPSLEVSYLNGSQDVSVSAHDDALQCPVHNLSVSFNVNGTVNGSGTTDQSGVYDRGAWWPSAGGVYNLGAISTATSECASGNTACVFQLGLPTSMISLDDSSKNVSAGTVVSNFAVCSSGIFNASGFPLSFRVNGTYSNGSPYSCGGSNTSLCDGRVSFAWNVSDAGTFSVHALFGGNADYAPCEAYALVTVNTLPLSVLFTVAPADFAPGTSVTLNATIMNPMTGSPFTDHIVTVRFFDYSTNSAVGTTNSVNGVALLQNVVYPADGSVHAYNATVLCCTDGYMTVQNVVSSPLQLTVGWDTTLSLMLVNGSSPSQFQVCGWLMSGSQPVCGRLVVLKINDTEVDLTTVGPPDIGKLAGFFGVMRDFPAVNNQNTTYTVTASFNGENPISASATSTAPDGTSYAACTTTQFSLKPSSNSTVLTVTPQSSQATTPTKTPEEMQEEAEENGSLRVWHEFSWLPPWYRVHFVAVYEGSDQFDQGISPIPFVGVTLAVAGPFLNMLSTLWWRIVWPIAAAIIGAEFFALLTSSAGPEIFLVAIGVSQGLKWGSLWANWNNVNGLVSAFIGGIFATAMGLIRSGFGFAADFLKLLLGLTDIAAVGFGNLYRICSFPVNIFYIGTIMNRLHELGAIA
jgi:hypothetical protein